MKTTQSHTDSSGIRKVKKYGDLALFKSLYEGHFLKQLLGKRPEALGTLILNTLHFSIASLAFGQNALFRRSFGLHTTGFMLSLSYLSFILIWNSAHVPFIFKPFFLPVVPLLPIFRSWSDIYRLIAIDKNSEYVMLYTLIFLIMATIHVCAIYFFGGNPSATKRGESWLYTMLSKHILISEYLVCGIIEPSISVLLGLIFWKVVHDPYFSLLLWLGASSVFIQQLADQAERSHRDILLKL
ncbi:hypothetical protein GC194_04975 [bacterium]|nr:hypothetical protein [bacterium]